MLLTYGLLTASLVFFAHHYAAVWEMQSMQHSFDALALRQKARIYAAGVKVRLMQRELDMVRDFTGKLSMMLEPEAAQPEQVGEAAMGGPEGAFPGTYFKKLARVTHRQLSLMRREVLVQEVTQQELMDKILSQKERLAHTPSIWPTSGRFTSGFGQRTSPLTGQREFHKGIDISAARGTPVYAPASGVVARAETFSSYGKVVEIDHGFGLRTRYAHLHKIEAKKGDKIYRGDLIGRVGSTGRSTASHLHYEVYINGKLTDPVRYILN